MVYRINWNQRSERYSVIRPGRGWMMKPWTPCSEKSFNSRSIVASVISPFQTKNGRVLNQRSERYSVIRPGRGWMMKPWTPCSEKSFNSRSIVALVISPFQTKNGRVLNSAGGFGNNVLRRARESTVVAAEAADKNISVTTRHFLISTGSLPFLRRMKPRQGFSTAADLHQGNARQFTELPDQLAKMTDSDR